MSARLRLIVISLVVTQRPARLSRALVAGPDRELRGLEVLISSSLLGIDPPEHTRLRKLVAGAFTARRMRQLSPQVAAIVGELIDGLQAASRRMTKIISTPGRTRSWGIGRATWSR